MSLLDEYQLPPLEEDFIENFTEENISKLGERMNEYDQKEEEEEEKEQESTYMHTDIIYKCILPILVPKETSLILINELDLEKESNYMEFLKDVLEPIDIEI